MNLEEALNSQTTAILMRPEGENVLLSSQELVPA